MTSRALVKNESLKIVGNEKTKRKFIESEFKESLESGTIKELHKNLVEATSRLKTLGVYSFVDTELIILDENTAEITINLKEKGIPTLKVESNLRKGTVVNDIHGEIKGALRNPIGYGEMISLSMAGSNTGSTDALFQVNVPNLLDAFYRSSLNFTLKSSDEYSGPQVSYHQNQQSCLLQLTSRNERHKLGYEFALRDEVPLPLEKESGARHKDTSIPILYSVMPSTKTALQYSYKRQSRAFSTDPDTAIKGSAVAVSLEAALPPGTANFIKSDFKAVSHFPLAPPIYGQQGLTLSLAAGIGILWPFHSLTSEPTVGLTSLSRSPVPEYPTSRLSDRFHSGGPADLRGFIPSGIGPRASSTSGGSLQGDALGGETRTSFTSILSVPIPIAPLAKSGSRAIVFLNSGSLGDSIYKWSLERELKLTRLCAGCGVAIPLGSSGAKVEVTYTLPIWKAPQDLNKGFQIGLSLDTL